MNTFERLLKVFNAVFEDDVDAGSVTTDASLREDIGINSIGMLYMVIALEEEFGIKFKNEDLQTIVTVQDVIDCIEAKI